LQDSVTDKCSRSLTLVLKLFRIHCSLGERLLIVVNALQFDEVGVDWWAVRRELSVGARQFKRNLDVSTLSIDHLLALEAGEDLLVTVGDYVDMNLHASQVVSGPWEQRSWAV